MAPYSESKFINQIIRFSTKQNHLSSTHKIYCARLWHTVTPPQSGQGDLMVDGFGFLWQLIEACNGDFGIIGDYGLQKG